MICVQCGLFFILDNKHFELVHHFKQEYRCMFCAQLFDNIDLMFDHILEHNGSIYCNLCKETFNNYEILFDHIDVHPDLHVYGCKTCQWTTACKVSYLDHVCCNIKVDSSSSAHDSGVESNEILSVKNEIKRSSKRKNAKQTLKEIKEVKCDNKEVLSVNCITNKTKDPTNLKFIAKCLRSDGYYYCPSCPKHLKTLRGFRYHLLRHNNLLKFTCELCGSKFPSNSKLQDHKTIHDLKRKKYPCPDCKQIYYTKCSLKVHAEKHSDGFICAHCSNKFNAKHSIKNHLTIYECCEEIFRCRNLYMIHILSKVHDFSCRQCSKRSDFDLKRHISIVHRETVGTHKCSLCGLLIKGQWNYKRHFRRRHKNAFS